MTTLSDTPTPTILQSETGGDSIKIEQGVLSANNDIKEGISLNSETQVIPVVKCEPSYSTVTDKNDSNSLGDFKSSDLNTNQSILPRDLKIKTEPSVEIDDRHLGEDPEENTRFDLRSINETPNTLPKIKITPTSKLIVSPNGTVENKRRYICPYENCTKSYGKSSHLRSHLTWHTGIKPFVCKEPSCNKGFTRSDELNRHIRTHTGEKPFECVQCRKKFSRSDHLTKHLATHNKHLAGSNGALAKKMKIDHQHVPQDILKAITTFRPGTMEFAYPTDMNFVNTYPPQNLYDSSQLSINPLEAKPEDSVKIKLEKPENSDEFIIGMPEDRINVSAYPTSPVLGLEESVKTEDLNIVVKTEPVDESHTSVLSKVLCEPNDDDIMPEANLPPILPCPTITQTVGTPKETYLLEQALNHMTDSVYNATRPFPCHQCTKNFKRQDDLNRHMRTHTGEKPFACVECNKRFMRSDHLKKHLKIHTNVRVKLEISVESK